MLRVGVDVHFDVDFSTFVHKVWLCFRVFFEVILMICSSSFSKTSRHRFFISFGSILEAFWHHFPQLFHVKNDPKQKQKPYAICSAGPRSELRSSREQKRNNAKRRLSILLARQQQVRSRTAPARVRRFRSITRNP